MRDLKTSILRAVAPRSRIGDAAAGFAPLKTADGTSLVEFATVLLVLAAMLFGICEFGTVLYAYHFVSHAAKSATRWAAVNGSTCGALGDNSCNGQNGMSNGPATSAGVLQYVKNMAPSGINTTNISISNACGLSDKSNCADSLPTACATTQNAAGCVVKVTVCYDYKFIFPLMPVGSSTKCPNSQVSGSTLTLSSTSEMIIAH